MASVPGVTPGSEKLTLDPHREQAVRGSLTSAVPLNLRSLGEGALEPTVEPHPHCLASV